MIKDKYIEQAHVVAFNNYNGDKVYKVSQIRECLFYDNKSSVPKPGPEDQTLEMLPEWISGRENGEKGKNIIRGILGNSTQTMHFLQKLGEYCCGIEADRDGFLEEVGYTLWNDALILKSIDSNFKEAQQTNIKDLRRRYPSAFQSFDKNNFSVIDRIAEFCKLTFARLSARLMPGRRKQ